MDIKKLKIGTRGSPLAMVQATTVQRLLGEHHPDLETEIVVIRTSGDWVPAHGEVRLSEAEGGKGQFAKEIEQALLAGAIDVAVHSMKDMDSNLPEGLVIDHMLPREDVRDAMILSEKLRECVKSVDDLPQGTNLGTASVRRAAFLLSQRGDLKISPFRGNVQTRIDKVRAGRTEAGLVDATFLAMAGLNRLGLSAEADIVLSVDEMLPAAAQGAVGIEMREGEAAIAALLAPLACRDTVLCVSAERAALKVLDGSCHTPIGAYAQIDKDGLIDLRLQVSSLDGQRAFKVRHRQGVLDVKAAALFGASLGDKLKCEVPKEMFA